MILLILGILIWAGVHLIPSLGAPLRAAAVGRIGEGPYKGVFALSLVAGIALMAVGWRSAGFESIYVPPSWSAPVTNVAMFVALVFFMGSNVPTNLKRIVRHPQLTGVVLWAASHLLANGDQRAVVLFGGIGLWAVLEMVFINRRDGAWEKPEPVPLAAEVQTLVAGAIGYALFAWGHPYIVGVRLFGG